MAKVTAPQNAPASTAQKVANDATDAILALKLEINKQYVITLAGGTPSWTTADSLYTTVKS